MSRRTIGPTATTPYNDALGASGGKSAIATQADVEAAVAVIPVTVTSSVATDVAGIVSDYNDLLDALESLGLITVEPGEVPE